MLFHSFVDFNLHIPSNALLFLIQAGLLATPTLPPEPTNVRKHRSSRANSIVDIRTSASP
jgi:hypothetical protein